MTRWYCPDCNKHFEAEADITEPVCPTCGRAGGKWSEIVKQTKTRQICGHVSDDSYRIRLDMKMPNGTEIHRPEGSKGFEHFSECHPDKIVEAMKALGFSK